MTHKSQPSGKHDHRPTMQADITDRFVQLAQLDRRIQALSQLRAAALYGLLLAISLLLFAGTARAAQPLLPFAAAALLGSITLPLLLVSHALLRLKRDAHRAVVRHLFRKGHRVDYPEFDAPGEIPAMLRVPTTHA